MNIPLFSEKPNQVPFRIKWLARIALLISAPLNWVSPSMIERLLLRLMKKKPVSTRAKAQEIEMEYVVLVNGVEAKRGALDALWL